MRRHAQKKIKLSQRIGERVCKIFVTVFLGVVIQPNPWFSQGKVSRICQICKPGVSYSTYRWVVGVRLVTVQNKSVLWISSFLFILTFLVVLNCEYCSLLSLNCSFATCGQCLRMNTVKSRCMRHINNSSLRRAETQIVPVATTSSGTRCVTNQYVHPLEVVLPPRLMLIHIQDIISYHPSSF